ncbi:hypothetical protein HDV00_004620 [Rhizophlyctis rosea]|nr:hypothetical protein HDV00_004620 [Rhizophlyctis rosea]
MVVADATSPVNLGGTVLPLWLVILLAIIIVGAVIAIIVLIYRRHAGNPESKEFIEMENGERRKGNEWTNKKGEPVFVEGSMLAEASGAPGGSNTLSRSRSIRSARSGEGNSVRRAQSRDKSRDRRKDGDSLPRKSSEYPSMDRKRAAAGRASPTGVRNAPPAVLPPYARNDVDNSSLDDSDVDYHVLAAARARAAGTGGLGLGSGLSGGLPAGSVIRIEEESLGTAINNVLNDDERFATMRSNRSARSDERSGTLQRNKSAKSVPDTGLDRSLSGKSKTKRSASQHNKRREGAGDRPASPPPVGSESGFYEASAAIPPPPLYTITVDPPTPTRNPSHDLMRQRSNKSLGTDKNGSLPRPSRARREDPSDQVRPRERSQSRTRNQSTSRRRDGRRGSTSPSEDDTPSSVLRANSSRRRGTSRQRSSSRRRDASPEDSSKRSVSKQRSAHSGGGSLHHSASNTGLSRSASRHQSGRSSPRRGGAIEDDEDAPLATVALQALQQNLGASSPTSPSRNVSMRKSRSNTKMSAGSRRVGNDTQVFSTDEDEPLHERARKLSTRRPGDFGSESLPRRGRGASRTRSPVSSEGSRPGSVATDILVID